MNSKLKAFLLTTTLVLTRLSHIDQRPPQNNMKVAQQLYVPDMLDGQTRREP
jgi:hypothetical protein